MSTPPDTTTRHDYTDAEILEAWSKSGPSIIDEASMLARFRAFLAALAALPKCPQAQSGPQAAEIAKLKEERGELDAHDVTEGVETARNIKRRLQAAEHINEGYRAMEAALFQAQEASKDLLTQRDKAHTELASLKEALTHAERWRDKIDTKLAEIVEAAERAGWDGVENSKSLPTFISDLAEGLSKAQAELAKWRSGAPAQLISTQRDSLESAVERAEKAEAELAALRQPIQADDGHADRWHAAAQAVAAVVTAQAIRRMEAVPVGDLLIIYKRSIEDELHSFGDRDEGEFTTDKVVELALEAIRARLIAAAKGEGQATPVVVNEPPKSEEQPDLSGESERQAQPWTPAVGDAVRLKSGGPVMTVNEFDAETHECECVSMSQGCIQRFLVSAACLTPAQP